MYTRRLLAIDPSLTCSGWALFAIEKGRLQAVGKIRSLAPSLPLAQRLKDLQMRITAMIEKLDLGRNDVLICEAPTTMRDPDAAFKVEQVRGIFEAVARAHQMNVPGRINPRSVQNEIMGLRGRQIPRNQVKETAAQVVRAVYEGTLVGMGFETTKAALRHHQDVVDAILVGSLAVTWVKVAMVSKVPLEEYFESRRPARRRTRVRGPSGRI